MRPLRQAAAVVATVVALLLGASAVAPQNTTAPVVPRPLCGVWC